MSCNNPTETTELQTTIDTLWIPSKEEVENKYIGLRTRDLRAKKINNDGVTWYLRDVESYYFWYYVGTRGEILKSMPHSSKNAALGFCF